MSTRDLVRDVAGARVHGTTRRAPRDVYAAEERGHMLPAPTKPFDVSYWSTAKNRCQAVASTSGLTELSQSRC